MVQEDMTYMTLQQPLQRQQGSQKVEHQSKYQHCETSFQEDMATAHFKKNAQIETNAKNKMLKEYEKKMGKAGNKRPLSRIPLWYFLHEILEVERCREMIQWEDESNLVFSIKKPKELAVLWGQIKNKETMTYPKLARGIRYYYGKGVIEKFNGKRFCYKFIVSKKTIAVLSKRKCLPEEVEIPSSLKISNRKRKLQSKNVQEQTPLKKLRERRNTGDSFDSTEFSPSNGSSDWDDDESFSESDWGNFDDIINEIFQSPSSTTDEIFNIIPKSTAAAVSAASDDSTAFIMRSTPLELNPVLSKIETTYTGFTTTSTYPTNTQPSMNSFLTELPSVSSGNLHNNIFCTESSGTTVVSQRNGYRSAIQTNTPTNGLSPPTFDTTFLRKKVKSESEKFSNYYPDPYSVYSGDMAEKRSTNMYSSLPDITSVYQSTDNDTNTTDFITSYLLEQNMNFVHDVTMDTSVLDNFL